MATTGVGYRTAADLLMEVSFHLCQPAVYTALTAPVTAGPSVSAAVTNTYGMYPGALLVVDLPGTATQEVITCTSVTDATHFVATFAKNHLAAVAVWGATFPTQQGTDPIFTQSEMLSYLSRAQNEFLTAVPCFYQRFFQNVSLGQIYQATPPTAILIDRIAASSIAIPITSLVRSGGTVTLTTPQPHGLSQYSTFAVVAPLDATFAGCFAVVSAPTPTTLTYIQYLPNASTTGGTIQSFLRLYETTQQELVMANRNWQVNYVGPLQSWFEDRAGLYRWGVGGLPSSNFPVELLCAVRDTDTLGMMDGFLVPDVCAHFVKYLAMAYIYSKDGVMSQPQMAEFCLKRYAQGVMATQRYIGAMKMETKR